MPDAAKSKNGDAAEEGGTEGPCPTASLAEFVAETSYDGLPHNVRELLSILFLDYMRVASIGERMSWSQWAKNYTQEFGGHGNSQILFSERQTDPVRAAFLNTTFAGSIDSDDTHVGAMLHPGSIVFSSALAIGQHIHASATDMFAAVAAGYEAMIRIALCLQPSHFNRGFQSTATCGRFGAVVAAGKLLFPGENAAQPIAEALGIAASSIGGLTQFYQSGSTVKRIHASQAAEIGVQSALLARSGFSGPTDILEGSNGFAQAYADEVDFSLLLDGLGETYRLLEVAVKGHACSARVQAAVEGVLDLCRKHSISARDIDEIHVGIPSVISGRLTRNDPIDVQAAQMSLPFSVSLASHVGRDAGSDHSLSVRDFESGQDDRSIRSLANRVRCEIDPEIEAKTTPESVPAKVRLDLKSGAQHSVFVSAPKGSPSRPYTRENHIGRFRYELSQRLSDEICDELINAAENPLSVEDVNWFGGKLSAKEE